MTSALDASGRPGTTAFEFGEAGLRGHGIELTYRLLGPGDRAYPFTERIELPPALPTPDPDDPVVRVLLDAVHRVFGLSYYKAGAPPSLHAGPAADADADFWDAVYRHGLGEFLHVNRLSPDAVGRFPRGAAPPEPTRGRIPRTDRVLLLVGGGKDSLVAREVVRAAGAEADAFSMGSAYWIERSARAAGLRHLAAVRKIDPALFELNRRGALNGHIPVSACIAFLALLVAYLGGYRAVIAANERSASEGSRVDGNRTVNHQWSKGLAFERLLADWRGRHLPDGPDYFSVLRPLSELAIGRAFARHPVYFDAFTSCNRNFRIEASEPARRWCGACAKCVFVQLILAPHLDPSDRTAIFGEDFLEAPENLPIVEALVGVSGTKPFDCVGTASECRAALTRLAAQGRLGPRLRAWADRELLPRVDDANALWDEAMSIAPDHLLTPFWERALRDYFESSSA